MRTFAADMKEHRGRYTQAIRLINGIVLLLAVLVIPGWIFDIPVLKSIIPDYSTMKFNTALGFVLLAISLQIQLPETTGGRIRAGQGLAIVVFLIGLLSLFEHIGNYDLGIDELLVADTAPDGSSVPGRMSAATALCFVLMGWFSMFLHSNGTVWRRLSLGAVHLVTAISFIAITGYLLGLSGVQKLPFITSMAIHTSLGFFLLSISASLSRPFSGLTALFTGSGIGNIMARSLFIRMIVAILLISYAAILSYRFDLVSVEFGIALFALSAILTSLVIIWRTARALNALHLQKEEIEDSLLQTRTMFDATPDPMIIIDEQGIIVMSNLQAELVFGYSREELIGQKVELLVPQRFRPQHVAHRTGFFRSPKARSMGSGQDLYALKKNGDEVSVEISLSPIQMAGRTWVSASIRDVSDRKEAERQYLEVSERLGIATKTSGIGIWDYYVQENRLIWDEAMCELFGIPQDLFDGTYESWEACVHPDDLHQITEELQATLEGTQDLDTEFRIIWPDGSIRHIKAMATVFRDAENRPVRMLGTNWDVTKLKQAEEELQESFRRNAIFIREAPNAIAMFDRQMRYIAASRQWMIDYNLEGRDVTGISHYDIFPEIGDDWKKIHSECLQGQINHCEEARFERADGSEQWITWDVRPWYVSEDTIGGLIMYTADITAQKLKDAERDRITEILDKTNEVARIGTWEVDLQTDEVRWSRVVKEIHEVPDDFKPELATGIAFYKPGQSQETIQNAVQAAIDRGIPYDVELELVTAKGNIRWVRAIGQAEFQDGKCKRLYGVFHDIDNIKRSELLLNQANEELRAIFNSGYVSIIGTDRQGIITHFSAGAERLLQYNAEEVVHRHTPAILHLEEEVKQRGEELSRRFGREIAGFDALVEVAKWEPYESREWTYIRKDGSTFPVQLIVTAIKNAEDEITGFLGVATDLTERKQAEERLRKYSVLESRNQEMEQFVYVASHDLREPLLTIKHYSELLFEDYGNCLDTEGKQVAEAISRSANRMDDLIRGLLEYSRLGNQKDLEEVDCNALVGNVLADLHQLLTSTDARITVHPLPKIKGHPLELTLLFQNLITNAIKFVAHGIRPEVEISGHPIEGGWEFHIKDNGPGIDAQDSDSIFKVFHRLHKRSEYDGTGIGLAHCKKVVESHNGTIRVHSPPGESSTFIFTILTEGA